MMIKRSWVQSPLGAICWLNLLVSSRDYCDAPCTDRVSKVSAKKVPHYPKLALPPPPPLPINENLADLEVSSQVGFLDFRFQSAALPTHPPTPCKMKSWRTWKFQAKFRFLYFRFQSTALPTPAHKMQSWQIWKFQVKLDYWTSDFKVLLYPAPPPAKNEIFEVSSQVESLEGKVVSKRAFELCDYIT